MADACGYANYTAQHLTYPPKGVIPLPRPSHVIPDKCRIWEDIVSSAEVLNPAFNIYRIFDTVSYLILNLSVSEMNSRNLQFPVLWDVLGRPCVSSVLTPLVLSNSAVYTRGTHRQIQTPIYFDRQDVKQAIHAPLNMTWKECNKKVFPDGDKSLPPVFTVLPNAIEKSERSVIVHGLADFVLIAEGSVEFLWLQ